MKNWAGNLIFTPQNIVAPKSIGEIQKVIQEKKNIRVRGSAHSWTDLIATDDTFMHLDNLQGVISIDEKHKRIRAWGGTKLSLLGEKAFEAGLALPNQGDINKQSVAGALSTGTHGTGITLQSMANQVRDLTIVTSSGEALSIGKEHPYYEASRVSFGSLGIIADLNLDFVDAYKLKVESFSENMDDCLVNLHSRLKENRHLEMFYFPQGDWSIVKMMNQTDQDITPKNVAHKFNDVVIENWLYEGLNLLANSTKSYALLDKVMRRFVSHQTKVDWSHRAFPADRTVKFMEMEYNLALEKFEEVFSEIKACIKKNKFQTLFPIEIRFVKADSIWLSPAFERDSVYFAVHTYISEDWKPYFESIQEIFKRHGGRPHWGKWHSLEYGDFEKIYPKWHNFLEIRKTLDPEGLFLNAHLNKIFRIF